MKPPSLTMHVYNAVPSLNHLVTSIEFRMNNSCLSLVPVLNRARMIIL
jgi:hypothetical protein